MSTHGHQLFLLVLVIITLLVTSPTKACLSRSMKLPMAAHGLAAATVDDTLYFAGGAVGPNFVEQIPMDNFDMYNTTSETWSKGQLSIPRAYLTLSRVGHKLIFAGGSRGPSDTVALPTSRIDIFDTLTRTWSTNELIEPRFAHVAAVYGDKVFFAGGTKEIAPTTTQTLDSIEMLDLTTNTTSLVFRMNSSRFTMTSGTVLDVLYFAGGRHQNLEPLDEIYLYNVTADEWRMARLPEGRSYPASVAYGSKIYFAGGWGRNFVASNRIDIYDVLTGTWDIKSLEEPRGMMAAVVLESKIYFAGGVGNVFSRFVDIIDVATGEQLSIRLQQARQMMAAVTDGRRVYFAGGLINDISNSDLIEIYDTDGIIDGLEIPRARSKFTSTTVNQLIFFAGGVLTDGSVTDIVDIYDERTGQWAQARLSHPRAYLSSAVIQNKVFFIGGTDSTNTSVSHIDIFDTMTRRWTIAALSQPRMDFTVVTSDRLLFIAGGALRIEDLSSPLNDVIDIYNDETGQWSTSRLSVARSFVSSYAYQHKVFFAGGFNGTSPSTDIDIFDTRTRTWAVAHLRRPRSFIGIGGINDRVLFAGGLGPLEFFSQMVDIYAMDTGQWSAGQLSQPRWQTEVVKVGEYLFFGAGRSRTLTTVVDAFHGPTRQFVPDLRLTVPRHGMLATGFDTKLIFAGGFYVNGAAQARGFSSALEVFEIIPTAPFTSYFLSNNKQWAHAVVSRNKIYYSANDYNMANVIELPLVTQPLADQSQFLGGSVSFNLTVLGRGMTYEWMHADTRINSTNSSVVVSNIGFESAGQYSVTSTDRCRNFVTSQAELSVLTFPVFTLRLNDTVMICGSTAVMIVDAQGTDVLYTWSISGARQETNGPAFTFAPQSCDIDYRICVDARNPSGTATSCALLRVSSYASIFSGPTAAEARSTWLLGDTAEIRVGIVEPLCTMHEWYENDLKRQTEIGARSSLFVDIMPSTSTHSFTVRAYCGTVITSHPVQLGVTLLTWWELLLTLVLVLGVVAVVVVVVVKVRTRFRVKQERELELKDLLDDAKRTVLTSNPNSASVINVRTWEWIPDDNYSYVPLSDLPFAIDASNVHFLKKKQQLEIGIWMQGDIIFSSKSKASKSTLKERLLNKSIQVSIYAPRSPKYEMTVDPQHFAIGADEEVRVLVSLVMKMTTKAKINLIIGLEERQIYSAIEFNLTSKISPWIDADEVIVQGEPIGVGGFGTVSKAIYRGQEVAFKKLKVQELVPSAVQEFEREIDLMMNLHHPNIIQFIGASRVKGSLAILTEFAPLGSLETSLMRKRLNVQQQVIVLYEAARALQFLHANNILHRDIKPENLLVFSLEPTAPVHVKLSDFGTSRLVSDQPSTMTRGVGTPMYMAPELFGKQGYERSADIYSFGVLMWSVVHQQEPYDSPEFQFPWDVPNFIKSGQRLPINDALCPAEVAQLIRECWAQEPADRPPISQVAQQLAAIVSALSSKPV